MEKAKSLKQIAIYHRNSIIWHVLKSFDNASGGNRTPLYYLLVGTLPVRTINWWSANLPPVWKGFSKLTPLSKSRKAELCLIDIINVMARQRKVSIFLMGFRNMYVRNIYVRNIRTLKQITFFRIRSSCKKICISIVFYSWPTRWISF